jgi:hypothetical protein
MAQWYVLRSGQETGPFDSAELKRLAESGQLSPIDMIWRKGLEAAVPASKVKGLFPTAASPTTEQPSTDKLTEHSRDVAAPHQANTLDKPKEQQRVIGNRRWVLLGGIGVLALLATASSVWFLVAGNTVQVTGGAWLQRNAGNSEPVRGLEVYFIKSQTEVAHKVAMLQALLRKEINICAELNDEISVSLLQIKKYQTDLPSTNRDFRGFNEIEQLTSLVDARRESIKEHEKTIGEIEKELKDINTSPSTELVDTREIFGNRYNSKNAFSVWTQCIADGLITKAHTDVDGKYSVEVQRGHYYAYATHVSGTSVIDWLIPIHAIDSKTLTITFHNETAESIRSAKLVGSWLSE